MLSVFSILKLSSNIHWKSHAKVLCNFTLNSRSHAKKSSQNILLYSYETSSLSRDKNSWYWILRRLNFSFLKWLLTAYLKKICDCPPVRTHYWLFYPRSKRLSISNPSFSKPFGTHTFYQGGSAGPAAISSTIYPMNLIFCRVLKTSLNVSEI